MLIGLAHDGQQLRRVGESHPRARWADAVVKRVRDLHEREGWTCSRIAVLLGIPLCTVRKWVGYERRATVAREWRRVAGQRRGGHCDFAPMPP
jgi:hypothetical protein